MNYEQELQKLEETRKKTLELVAELDGKLARREIDGIHHQIMLHDLLLGKTRQEIISYLDFEKKKILFKMQQEKEDELQASNRRAKITIATTTLVLLMIVSGILFLENNGTTGFVVGNFTFEEPVQITTSDAFEQTLNHTNITGLKISGTIDKGSALVKLRLENGNEITVGEIIATETGETYTLTTDKKNYLLGEQVNITITPNTEGVSTYVYFNEDSTIVTDGTFLPQTLGAYRIVTIITDGQNIVRLELNFTVTEELIEETQETISATLGQENIFTEICQDSCEFEVTSNPTIIIQPNNDATLTLNKIIVTTKKENNAPTQIREFRTIEINTSQELELDLSQYFIDTDDEEIYYDVSDNQLIIANIENNILTIIGQIAGEQTTHIYATDQKEITTSNDFIIRVNPSIRTPNNLTNETVNETTIDNNITTNITTELEINNTLNSTINETNSTINQSEADCNLPLNERPSICFIGLEEDAFESLTATLENRDRAVVGKFTRFGNLIIRGLLVQGTDNEPDNSDFQVNYVQNTGFTEQVETTAWIHSKSGNLYLKGQIFENQEVLEPNQFNTFIIKNRHGIILGYFDQITGDLYLRGNIVQLGKI